MPRRIWGEQRELRADYQKDVDQLASEFAAPHDFGQPLILEQPIGPHGDYQLTVIWDSFEGKDPPTREHVIRDAIRQSEGEDRLSRLSIATGLTLPEASEHGILPYAVVPAIRPDDAVTMQECLDALREQGGSSLLGENRVLLCFADLQSAMDAVRRLTIALPGSEKVWIVTKDMGPVDFWQHR